MADNTAADHTENDTEAVSDEERERMLAFTRRFDLRRIIGFVFLVYGVILVIMGVINGDSDKAKAAGIAVNLWTGLAMLVGGVLFFVWDRMAPVKADDLGDAGAAESTGS